MLYIDYFDAAADADFAAVLTAAAFLHACHADADIDFR